MSARSGTMPVDGAASASPIKKRKKKVVKPLSKEKLEQFTADAENRGVLYFSRIPPFLKPTALRTLLEGYGTEVLRIYLAPESRESRAGRVRAGGNKKKSFSEGWVEFGDKRRAKRLASTLNNTPMGGGHRNFYAHDLWNVKYLHKFKWNHLTEKMAYEQRVKRDKLQQELSAAKKESAFYLRKVDEAKAIAAMEEKRKKKAAAAAGASGGGGGGDAAPATAAGKKRKQESGGGGGEGEEGGLQQVRRRFKQRRVAADPLSKMGRNDVLSSLLGGGGD